MHISAGFLRSARLCHALPVRRSVATSLARLRVSSASQHRHSHQVRRSNLRQTDGCRRAVQVSAAVAEAPPGAQIANEDGYNVTEEKLSGSRRRSTVIAPAKQCKRAWTRMIKQARKEIKAPGFRDMKSVSEATLLPYLGGELGAKAAAVEELIRFLPKEVVDLTAHALSDSIIPDLTDDLVKAFDVDKPFTYQLVYDVEPKLTWKQPYKGMKVEVTAAGDDNTDQAKVAQELLKLKKKKSDLKVVQGRGVQLGDSAVVDFDARQSDTGEEFQGAKRRKTTLDTDSADMQFLPGVANAMVGMKVGESREFQMILPDDFEPAALRGVDVTCTVGVSELFEYNMPEFDDDLAEELAPGCGGVQGLQAQLLRLQKAKTAQDNEEAVDEALMASVVHLVECDVPQSMTEEMGQQEYQARLHTAQAKGEITYEQAMQLAKPESLANYIHKHKHHLEDLILRQMAFEHICAAEKLTVSDSEFQDEYDSAVRDFTEQKQEFDDERLREQVSEALKGPKIVQWLRDNCEVTMLAPQA